MLGNDKCSEDKYNRVSGQRDVFLGRMIIEDFLKGVNS